MISYGMTESSPMSPAVRRIEHPAHIPNSAGGSSTDGDFPLIGDYGFLSDCETTALVAPSGNIEWLCLPRMDSPSVFGAILDRRAGRFRLGPADTLVPAARRYLPGTLILETSWGTPGGWCIVRDVLLLGPWHHDDELSHTHRRAPTDYDADHVLLRTVRCLSGEVQITLACEPVLEYGQEQVSWQHTPGRGYHSLTTTKSTAEIQLRLDSDMRLGYEGGTAVARTLLKQGHSRYCALSWTEHAGPENYADAKRRLIWTAHHWQHWLARGRFPDHPWRSHLQRSALTLKGLTFAPTGALIAAATTSLPETPQGERNWDYRYSWIRDATFTLMGLYSLGFDWEADDYFWFIADIAERNPNLQVMYGVDGEHDLAEVQLPRLSGYDGARPVRVGNGAYDQKQHDVWGAVIAAVYLHSRAQERLDDRLWPVLRHQVETALAHWNEPDCGMWEVRGKPQHFTSSKVMCWLAAHWGARLARMRRETDLEIRWRAAADQIKQEICDRGVDARGVFTQSFDSPALDASVLLLPLVRFLPSKRPPHSGHRARHRRRAQRRRVGPSLSCCGNR